MTRRPVLGLALVVLFGLSLTVPCLALGLRDGVSTKPAAGCAGEETRRADLVCASSFKPAPTPEAPQPTSLAVVKIPLESPLVLSKDGLDASAANPVAREHAPPAYLLHNAFLI